MCTYFATFDFVFLLESWLKENVGFVLDLPGYLYYNFCRPISNSRSKRGAGGLLLYVKQELEVGIKVLPPGNIPDRVWIVLDKVTFGLAMDLYIGIWYVPPSTSCCAWLSDTQWQLLETEIEKYKLLGQVVVLGDLNARAGQLKDYIALDAVPDSMPNHVYSVDVSTPRASQDLTANAYGKNLIDLCITTGLRIANGRCGLDNGIGKFTCYTANGSSVVDYVLADSSMLSSVENFNIEDLQQYSDHCPITFNFPVGRNSANIKAIQKKADALLEERLLRIDGEDNQEETNMEGVFQSGIWNEEQKQVLLDLLNSRDNQDKMSELRTSLSDLDIEECVQDFMTAVADIAAKSGAITFRSQKSSRNRANSVFPCNKWFDQECKDMKRKVNDQLKTWRQDRDRATFKCYLDLKKAYKKLIRRKKREQNTCFNTMLRDLNTTNPKEFWKLLGLGKKKRKIETAVQISVEDWRNHFCRLHQVSGIEKVPINLPQISNEVLDGDIIVDEVRTVIKGLRNGKASGVDGLTAELFKCMDNESLVTLTALYNRILSCGHFPPSWSKGIIVPYTRMEVWRMLTTIEESPYYQLLPKFSLHYWRVVFRSGQKKVVLFLTANSDSEVRTEPQMQSLS